MFRPIAKLILNTFDLRKFYRNQAVDISIKIFPKVCVSKFKADLIKYERDACVADFPVHGIWPCYGDDIDESGCLEFHYFWQDLFVAQRIFKNSPQRHIDIGSRISGFVAHVASFREIEVFDIRPLSVSIPNVRFVQADIICENDNLNSITDSISILHALEHFGLGRYGDPIDYQGHLKGFKNISNMLKPGGILYLSVPMGQQRTEFHAHRVFSIRYLLNMFRSQYEIVMFSYVDDQNNFHEDCDPNLGIEDDYSCMYGCAIFELKKK